jgi:hypothetical protein
MIPYHVKRDLLGALGGLFYIALFIAGCMLVAWSQQGRPTLLRCVTTANGTYVCENM